ncbi:MAG: DUF2157 domain-containing protein [Rhodospirillales bacterium]|nr:DUF2157 domain-containing protein [Alphaproteobacteria bacterium]MCB9986656.1 DUF2157 domain-containing protein [Rhodospirillales bacterium]USO06816.1 MAG: DUF2157 domain-containing protein [Rhodospirillales bacterium]
MSLRGKLDRWKDEGLITTDQAERILAHETARNANRFRGGYTAAGLLSVLLGVALIVAANWQQIPWQMRLGGNFVLNAVLAVLVWRWRDNPARALWREGALMALWGLTLTLIALIGQSFQLGGEAYTAMRLWFWVTTPMVLLFAQSRFLARLWAAAFMIYVPYDLIATTCDHTQDWAIRKTVILGIGIVLPFFAYALGRWPRFALNRPVMAHTLRRLAGLIAALGASAASLEFYDFIHTPVELAVPVSFALAAVALRFALHPRLKTQDDRDALDLLAVSAIFMCLPFLAQTQSSWFALADFVAYWGIIGAFWQQAGHTRLVSLSVKLVTLRLYLGFLEVFGSLMLSGFGFIAMGLVMIAMVRAARWLDRRLKGAAAR